MKSMSDFKNFMPLRLEFLDDFVLSIADISGPAHVYRGPVC